MNNGIDTSEDKTLINAIEKVPNYKLIINLIEQTINDKKTDIKKEYKKIVYSIIEHYLIVPCLNDFFSANDNDYIVKISNMNDIKGCNSGGHKCITVANRYNVSIIKKSGYVNQLFLDISVLNGALNNNNIDIYDEDKNSYSALEYLNKKLFRDTKNNRSVIISCATMFGKTEQGFVSEINKSVSEKQQLMLIKSLKNFQQYEKLAESREINEVDKKCINIINVNAYNFTNQLLGKIRMKQYLKQYLEEQKQISIMEEEKLKKEQEKLKEKNKQRNIMQYKKLKKEHKKMKLMEKTKYNYKATNKNNYRK